jgi:hypothetical protein
VGVETLVPVAGGDDDPAVESGAVPDEAAELRRVLIAGLPARSSLHARSRRNRCRAGTPFDVVVLLREEVGVAVAAAVRSAEEEEGRGSGETRAWWWNAFERIRLGRQSSVLVGARKAFGLVRMRLLFGEARIEEGESEMTSASGGPRSKKSRTHWVLARSVVSRRANQRDERQACIVVIYSSSSLRGPAEEQERGPARGPRGSRPAQESASPSKLLFRHSPRLSCPT